MKTIAGIFLLTCMASCATVPLTGRKQLSLVDDSQMQQQATLAYKDLLSDPKTKVIKGTADAQMLQRVGSRVASAITTYLKNSGYGNQYNYNWEFNLIQSPEVNAWCMPGGKVAVYTGILPVTKTDAGLAAVLGHEIGHAIAKHSSERASQTMAAQIGAVAVDAATAKQTGITRNLINNLYGVGGQVGLLKFSRDQESEADKMGLIFMAMAGYDPNEALKFWERMANTQKGGQAPPEFLSTHPSDSRRIADIQRLLPQAMKYYKK
ncbi:Peptidase family M48 [bacterium A37T11]|nr:Peptidase family M48 [bacterium A37T11]